jgi:hypothetical protein
MLAPAGGGVRPAGAPGAAGWCARTRLHLSSQRRHDLVHAFNLGHRLFGRLTQGFQFLRARGIDGDRKHHAVARDHRVRYQPQRHQITCQIRPLDLRQCLQHIGFCYHFIPLPILLRQPEGLPKINLFSGVCQLHL